MLFETPALSEHELRVTADIEDVKKKLRFRLDEPRRWFGSLRRISMARAIQGSNSIEGYDAPLDDAAAVDLGEEPLDADEETRLALKGYRDAMTYVLQLGSEVDSSYSEQLLKSLHFMMTNYDLKNRPGLWRSGAIFVRNDETGDVVYEGADIDDVPDLMHELVARLNGEPNVHPIVHAGMAHLNLVMIHPFRDGNGRMARCLQTLVLAREGILSPVFCSIEEYLGRNTQAYYDVLAAVGAGRWQPERNATRWVRFILTAHLRQARTLLRRVKESERLWGELEELISTHGLPERVTPVLFDAASGFRVRNSTYRAIADAEDGKITEAMASRDLRNMVAAGLLEARGEKRGRFYVGTATLLAIRHTIIESRDRRDDSDPFENAPAPGQLFVP
jgi:Fic family protein